MDRHRRRRLNYYSYADRRIHRLGVPEEMRFIHTLRETAPDTLWVASVGCGIFRITLGGSQTHPEIREVKRLHFNEELEVKKFFFALYEQNDSIMWFGNRGGGAVPTHAYEYAPDRQIRPQPQRHRQRHLHDPPDPGQEPLVRHERRTDTGRPRHDAHPGITNTVHGILDDRNGDLWLSTNRGLVQYTPTRAT